MCGINGFITRNKNFDPTLRIEEMNGALSHRGPDDSGSMILPLSDFSLALGQARLSIIDLSPRGHQPMYYTHGAGASNDRFQKMEKYDLVIVFNGEIYNYLDIRTELQTLGYVFSTESDTEIILAGYHAWGREVVKRFNGMWAFCLFDTIRGTAFCSRDRFGKKPFYYYIDGENFIFSSEIKGILAHTELEINKKENIQLDALDFFFTVGYIPSPLSVYKNISKLEAGHNLEVKIENGEITSHDETYYEIPDFAPIEERDLLIDEGKKLLADAVKIRMFSADVPVGAFLSGGLDSSAVVAEMTKHTENGKLHTFSIGFEGKYDETPFIEIVKNAFGTNHHHAYFQKEHFQKMVDTIAYHYDEPFGDYSSFPTTFVSQLAREHVTVSLSGDGGDEIFGGYMMHQVAVQMDILYSLPLFLRKLFSKIIPATFDNLSLLSKLREAFRVSTFPKEDFYAELGGSTLYRPDVYKAWTREKLRFLLEKNHGNFVQTIIDFDLFYNTIPDNFLVKVDRASMSQSLEVRSPFLDYRFVELARRIPTKWKVSLTKTKILMRDIIADIVPESIVKRDKHGFEPPITLWINSPEYRTKIESGCEALFEEGILSEKWYRFYKDRVFRENNQVFTVFIIKLFLLIEWRKKWII